MWQMYIRGKLLFVGYIFSSQSCSVRDLQKQISRTRGDYRLGLSLPSDYKFRYHCTITSVNLIYNSNHVNCVNWYRIKLKLLSRVIVELVTTNKAQVNCFTKKYLIKFNLLTHIFLSFTCSDTVNKPSATDSHNSQDATLTGGDDTTLTASVEIEKANDM